MHSAHPIHRALVTFSNATTGEVRVKIPTILGIDSEVALSYIGRKAPWIVPTIGDQIVVTSDDTNLTNVFWVQTDNAYATTAGSAGSAGTATYATTAGSATNATNATNATTAGSATTATTAGYATTAGSATNTGLTKLQRVEFVGVTAVNFDNVFTSQFTNYRVSIETTSGGLAGRVVCASLRSGGTTNSSLSYAQGILAWSGSYANGSAVTVSAAGQVQEGWVIWSDVFQGADAYMDIYRPQVSGFPTSFLGFRQNRFNAGNTDGFNVRQVSGRIDSEASFDGIRFYSGISNAFPNGTMSGTITIYGYNK
jgi:hypothetical protein